MTSINSVTYNNTQNMAVKNVSEKVTRADRESKTVQNELTTEQQRMNRVSADEKISNEEKLKKRQEIQRQIDELNRKLKLLQVEEKEEEKQFQRQEEKKIILREDMMEKDDKKADRKQQSVEDEKDKEKQKEESDKLGTLTRKVKNMLSSQNTANNDKIEVSSVKKNEQKQGVLKSEIKADEVRGSDAAAKKEELENMREREKINAQIRELKSQLNNQQNTTRMHDNARIIIKQ